VRLEKACRQRRLFDEKRAVARIDVRRKLFFPVIRGIGVKLVSSGLGYDDRRGRFDAVGERPLFETANMRVDQI
jgi:hypothetical protein